MKFLLHTHNFPKQKLNLQEIKKIYRKRILPIRYLNSPSHLPYVSMLDKR